MKKQIKKLDELKQSGFQQMGPECMAKRDKDRAMIYRCIGEDSYIREFDGQVKYVEDLFRNHRF